MPSLDVLHAHSLPVQEIAQAFRAVSLVNSLPTALLAEVEHERRQLVDRVIDTLGAAVHNVDSVVARVLNKLLHVASESREVSGDARHAHDGALSGSVSPGLIVGSENAQMATSDEIIVVEGKNRVSRVEELGVEDDLDSVRRVVEQLHSSDLVQNRVLMIVDHVVGDDGRKSTSLHGEEATAEQDSILGGNELLLIGHRVTIVPLQRSLKDAASNALLNDMGGVSQGLDHSLTLESFHSERSSLRRHDDEGHNRDLASCGLETVVETGQRLDKHVDTLVSELVTAGSEEVEGVINVEIVVTVEVSSYKVMDLFLGLLMEVLEFVDSGEFGNVEAIGQDTIRLSF